MKQRSIVKRRPAETTTGAVATIVAVCALLGVDVSEEAIAAIAVAIGFIPAVVTAVVDRVRSL